MRTIQEELLKKTKILEKKFIRASKLEARLLLSYALKKDINWTFLNPYEEISNKEIVKLNYLIKKKLNFTPTAYLTGSKEFWNLKFKVNKHTLIPRPETELIISNIKKKINKEKFFSILDLGTGTGCILLSILSEFKNAYGIGTDFSRKVINTARYNAEQNRLSKRSLFSIQDWNSKESFKKLLYLNKKFTGKNKFDLIVSNPPYILKKDIPNLAPDVQFEPKLSLNGGVNGLNSYIKIFPELKSILSKNGFVYFEINPIKAKEIKKLLKKESFKKIFFIKDLSKKKRIVFAK